MPNNGMSTVMSFLAFGICLLAAARILTKGLKNKYAPMKTAEAVVVNKRIVETFSKYAGNGKREQYAVVFSVDGGEKTFYVSQFSYDGYRIGERGMLKYRGEQIVEFM